MDVKIMVSIGLGIPSVLPFKQILKYSMLADEYGIDLKVKKIIKAEEARNGPSGFGVYSLLYNGKLLEDHYISSTRFKNILKKELKP